MDIHKNVRLTVHGRERIVELLQGGQSVAAYVLDQSDGLDHHHAENAIDDDPVTSFVWIGVLPMAAQGIAQPLCRLGCPPAHT